MEYNQLLDFIDNLDTTAYRHLVMFYEEPEYAKLVQMRFINDGLEKGECCIYVVNDEQDLLFTRREMIAYGIDVDGYGKRGLLHLHVKRVAKDLESFKHTIRMIYEETTEKFFNYYRHQQHQQQQEQKQQPPMPPPIRGVGLAIPRALAEKDSGGGSSQRGTGATVQLQIERFLNDEMVSTFTGVWLCPYQLDDIDAHMGKRWMEDMLKSHDAVLFMPKLSNGIALDLRDATL
ncbi:MAG TPA: MEDS domain-containing protein [Nitrososphaera sp.]|jgi:hypothetical protein